MFRADTIVSEPVTYDPEQPVDLVIWLGAFAGPGADAGRQTRVYVECNHRPVIDAAAPAFDGRGCETAIGWNNIDYSAVGKAFTGVVESVTPEATVPLP
jgi:hypothetical protein